MSIKLPHSSPVVAKKTFCRICEAHCGLEATIDGEGAVQIRPDKNHPVSKGYVCVKGMALGSLHSDPDRINFPMKKVDGEWHRITWQQAFKEIGKKVRALRKAHGERSIAMYAGNPTFFNFKSILIAHDFMEALESPNLFSSHSIDVNNKLYVRMKMYGRSVVSTTPDLENTNFLLCMGTNPVVSQMSTIQVVNALEKLQSIEKRGGHVYIIDPRKSETADKVGEHHFIRPGTDVYLLLSILNLLIEEKNPDINDFSAIARNIEPSIELARNWPPARGAAVTGIPEEQIRELAKNFMEADGSTIYMSTGVNMGPFGAQAYWIAQCLLLLSGNLDRKGGMLFGTGPYDTLALAQELNIGGESPDRTLKSQMSKVAGCFPSNALVDEITIDDPDKIRALFVTSGNPVHSIPGGQLDAAMRELELVVCIDLYRSDTAELADYLLPATDMLERSDIPIAWLSQQIEPHIQYTEAVVEPKYERREEWEIFQSLAVACGAPMFKSGACNNLAYINMALGKIPFGDWRITPDKILRKLINDGGRVDFDQLLENPQGIAMPDYDSGKFIGERVPTNDGKIDLAPAELLADAPRLEMEVERLVDGEGLFLIGKRDRRTHNSWMHNVSRIKHPETNHIIMNPIDARDRNVGEGDIVTISSDNETTIELPTMISEEIMPGVIAVPHGWGQRSTGLSKASNLKGKNVNEIVPGGSGNMDVVSGQAFMVAHRVTVKRQSPATA